MTKQEENWELMTTLNIPWGECNKIEDEADREFLLGKVTQVKKLVAEQQRQQQQQQQQQQGGGVWTP